MYDRTQIVCLHTLSLFLLFVHPNTYSLFSIDSSSILYSHEVISLSLLAGLLATLFLNLLPGPRRRSRPYRESIFVRENSI
jgi:hypothetical protein